MNEMLKLMHDRRSTRAYRPEPLQEAVIQQILEAGRFAPSGMNKQLNHFYVITDPNYLADLTALVSRKMENYRDKDFRYGAPVLVLVTNQKESTTCVQDASCAMENMMLAAFSLGVGSCWINQLRETCDVPEVRDAGGDAGGRTGPGLARRGLPRPPGEDREPGVLGPLRRGTKIFQIRGNFLGRTIVQCRVRRSQADRSP